MNSSLPILLAILLSAQNFAILGDARPENGSAEEPAPEVPPNRTLTADICRKHVLHVNAHDGGSFWQPASLDHYHRCLWILRHQAVPPPREAFIGGHHYPTIVLANHREPEMKMPIDKHLPRPRRRHSDIPLQAFQDTQQEFASFESRVPYHFVVPFYDVNIGNIIKNQGSMNHWQSYQMQLMLRPGDVAIDVGGNLGCYTIALAEAVGPGGRVLAFEPFRWMHQLLTANVALNGFQNVWPVQVALGSKSEVIPLFSPQLRFFSSPGGVRVAHQAEQVAGRPEHESFQLYDLMAREAEMVRVAKLDDLVLEEQTGRMWGLPIPLANVRLIKIDVEGMEAAVIDGAADVIRTFKPIIWSENNAYFESNGKDITFLQSLAALGYSCSKAPSAPTDVICMDDSGQGHRI